MRDFLRAFRARGTALALPHAGDNRPPRVEQREPGTMAATAQKILVVDDDEIVRISLVRVLTKDGYGVDEAVSGVDAVKKLEAGAYALVFLDLRMPRLGGITVLQHVRKHHPEVPVIVVTGFPSIENAKESIELGAFDFLLKPVEVTRIREVTQRALAAAPWTLQRRC
jgi:DNA-binding NtrC family response regulator